MAVEAVQLGAEVARRSSSHINGGCGKRSSACSLCSTHSGGCLRPGARRRGLGVGLPLGLYGGLEFGIRLAPHVVREGGQVPSGVRQLQHAGDDVFEQLWCVPLGWVDGKLFNDIEVQINITHFLACRKINQKRVHFREKQARSSIMFMTAGSSSGTEFPTAERGNRVRKVRSFVGEVTFLNPISHS